MGEEIEIGSWVEWPGAIGLDQGKVMSVRHDAYVVQTKAGSAPSYTTVARSRGVSKVAPLTKPVRQDKS